MTAQERTYLKLAVSEARRARVPIENACSECGTEPDNRVIGCKRCAERHLSRKRRMA